jgi:hypothetical protein
LRIACGDSAQGVLYIEKPCHADAWLRFFLFLHLLSKLNGVKTKKPGHFVPGFSM